MGQLNHAFRELLPTLGVDRDAAEQLSHAARALARMSPSMATAITCTRDVADEQLPALAALARAVAAKHTLGVRIELGNPVRVRFTRAPTPEHACVRRCDARARRRQIGLRS